MFGSAAFVTRMGFSLGRCFRARSVAPHGLVGLPPEAGSTALGWKVAAKSVRERHAAA